MLIAITPADRFMNQSAVDTQGIQRIINGLNSQLTFTSQTMLSSSPLGPVLISPIPMGFGDHYMLPWNFIEFQIPDHPVSTKFTITRFEDVFQVSVQVGSGYNTTTLYADFDYYLNLKRFCIVYGFMVQNYGAGRQAVMDAAFIDLPTLLGYIVTFNSRDRTQFTLGDPRVYNVNNDHTSQPTHNLGDIREITNPRDNPTGITKRPHERVGHERTLASGKVIEVAPAIVHRDEYVPDNQPKKLKY